MVVEPTYGYLMPRENIVNITRPLRLVDEHGEEVVYTWCQVPWTS